MRVLTESPSNRSVSNWYKRNWNSHACASSIAGRTYALVIRGEAYRYGCHEHGVMLQDAIMESQRDMITESLRSCGAKVGVFLPIDPRGCANITLLQRLASWHGKHVHSSATVIARTQGQNVRGALQLFSSWAADFDTMILSRYDLRILQPFSTWHGCQDSSTIGIASRCEMQQWRNWNCSSDILFVVPRALLWAFNASVGASLYAHDSRYFNAPRGKAKLNPSACFAPSGESTSPGVPKGLGHGCYNSIAHRIGYEQLSFCWPSTSGVTEPNEYYQCCTHGPSRALREFERVLNGTSSLVHTSPSSHAKLSSIPAHNRVTIADYAAHWRKTAAGRFIENRVKLLM
jgi:hypothetical protein